MAIMVVISCICSRYSCTLVDSTGRTSSYVGRSSKVCSARVNLQQQVEEAIRALNADNDCKEKFMDVRETSAHPYLPKV